MIFSSASMKSLGPRRYTAFASDLRRDKSNADLYLS